MPAMIGAPSDQHEAVQAVGQVAEAQWALTAWVTIRGQDVEGAHRRLHVLLGSALYRISLDHGRKETTPAPR